MGQRRMMEATFILAAIFLVNGQRPLFPDFPDPRIVIVGPTGAGKSSLANALLGCDPRGKDCLFEVCDNTNSCTKQTTAGTGQWLGEGKNFTVVDTPGFGDSEHEDDALVESMMDFLANDLDHSNTMLLLLDGRLTRFSDGLQTMIKRMTLMFGTGWWDYVIVGVSFWPYDQHSIEERQCYPDYPDLPCHDESWFQGEINGQLHDKFGTEKNFTFVFTDSFSQTAGPPHFNTDDPLQQEHWKEETGILWDITTSRNGTFGFMTINDFMEENARQRAEIKWLNDVITNNITELQEQIKKLETQADDQEGRIQSNIESIENQATEISDLGIQGDNQEGRIQSNEESIENQAIEISDLDIQCDAQEGRISDLETQADAQEGRIQSNVMNIVNLEILGDSHEYKIENHAKDITKINSDITNINSDISIIQDNLENLMMTSQFCSYQYHWTTSNHVITYESLTLQNTNIPGAEMNINTGVFTAGASGTYGVDLSMYMVSSSGSTYNEVFIRQNGANLQETRMRSYVATSHNSGETGGRSQMVHLNKGDTLSVYAASIHDLWRITFCINLV